MKHEVEVTLKVWVDEGVYWPEEVQQVVANNPDDLYKDILSHLIAALVLSAGKIHGVQFDGAAAQVLSTSEVD